MKFKWLLELIEGLKHEKEFCEEIKKIITSSKEANDLKNDADDDKENRKPVVKAGSEKSPTTNKTIPAICSKCQKTLTCSHCEHKDFFAVPQSSIGKVFELDIVDEDFLSSTSISCEPSKFTSQNQDSKSQKSDGWDCERSVGSVAKDVAKMTPASLFANKTPAKKTPNKNKQAAPRTEKTSPKPTLSKTRLRINEFDASVTEDELLKTFQKFGKIERLKIHMNCYGERYAIVSYENEEGAKKALKCTVNFKGKRLRLFNNKEWAHTNGSAAWRKQKFGSSNW